MISAEFMLRLNNDVNEIYEKIKGLDSDWFFSAICILIEMKCADDDIDVVEAMEFASRPDTYKVLMRFSKGE